MTGKKRILRRSEFAKAGIARERGKRDYRFHLWRNPDTVREAAGEYD